jgi:heparan-sulfate lyase
MNRVIKIILVVILLLISCHQHFFAQTASDQQIIEVNAQLENFRKQWTKDLAFDSPFGIIQLCDLLDLDYPGLEKVKVAAAKQKWEKAEKELLHYFKTVKSYEKPAVKKLSEKEIEASESALNHYFRGNKEAHPLIYRGADIDWVSPAFYNGKEIKDAEWQFIFQRLLWWEALAKAYTLKGDVRYFDEWQYELVDWANDILPIDKEAPYYIRRGMETYYRCVRLKKVLPYFIHEKRFDEKTLLYFLTAFHMNAEHVRTVYSDKGNHLLGELTTVFENGIFFPEFKKSKEWIDETVTKIPERMFIEIYPDGMNNELIFSYHSMYLGLFTNSYALFKEHGYDKYLPDEYLCRLKKMADVYMYQMFPDNTISQFGDAWKHRDAAHIFEKNVSRLNPEHPNLEFIVSKGKNGTPPARTSVAYPISGFYFFRSDWTKEAVFMAMKNNYKLAWHSQIDNGSFELYALGRNFMIDSGAYIYNSDDPQEQNWRKWFRSTKAHQTLTLNNENIEIDAKHIFWKENDNLTCLVNENRSYDSLIHRRTTLFIDSKYFLVYDEAIGAAEGEVRTHYQLVPCDYVLDEAERTITTKFEKGANLIVKNFNTGNETTLEKEEGWISYSILKKEERPAWSFKINKSKEQDKVTFLTALLPYSEGESLKVIDATVESNGNDLYFQLLVDAQVYSIKLNAANGIVERIQ